MMGIQIPEWIKEKCGLVELSSYDGLQKLRVDSYNNREGNLPGKWCELCKNKGFIMTIVDGYEVEKECECMPARKAEKRIRQSGLSDLLEIYTMDSYQTPERWQQEVKRAAQRFLHDSGNWFYIGGTPGSGKTHICTAICGELLKQNNPVRYMTWTTEIRQLKALANDESYDEKFFSFANAPVLYIDDLFKVKKGAELTASDVQRTYELINYRYINRSLTTIISSEKSVGELIDIDEATGSRIYEMAKKYTLQLSGSGKNWRLK